MTRLPDYVRLLTSASLLALGAAGPRALHAEEMLTLPTISVAAPDAEEGQSYGATTASSATRTRTDVRDIPRAITTVTHQELKDSGATSIDDALAGVSGITQTNTVGGKEDAVIRRGFGESRDRSILTDGLKTALPHSFNATTDHVEVLKGPASTLYGVLDPGGMVNVIPKAPELKFSGRAYVREDMMGDGKFATTQGIDVTGPLSEHVTYRFVAEHEAGDYWRNFGKTRNSTIAPTLKWDDGVNSLTLSYMRNNYRAPYDRGTLWDSTNQRFLNVSRRTRLDEPWSQYVGHDDLTTLKGTHDFGNGWTLSAVYGLSHDEFTADQVRVTKYNAATGIATRRADVRGYYHTTVQSARTDLTGTTIIGGMTNDLLFGADWNRETTRRSSLETCESGTTLDVYDPVYGTISPCDYDASAAAREYETLNTASAYVQDSLHLTQSLIFSAGFRSQHYDVVAGSGDTRNSDTSGWAQLPNAGLVWTLTPSLSLYTSASKSFRPNDSINSEYGALKPETGTSYEIGAKFSLFQGLTGTFALYDAHKRNVAYSTTVDDETVWRTAGAVRSKGAELDLAGRLTERLQLQASYAHTDAKVTSDPDYAGKRLPNVAADTASLRLAFDQGPVFGGKGHLRYGGGVRYVGKRAADEENSFYLPEYALVDAFAAYTIQTTHPVTLQLNLYNIFDKTYYVSAIGSSDYGISVGQPMSASLTVSVSF